MLTKSEVPGALEHEVYWGLRIETGLCIVEVVLLEVGAPEPCVGVVLVVEEIVDVETEIQRRRFLHSLRSVEMTGRAVISSEAERSLYPFGTMAVRDGNRGLIL